MKIEFATRYDVHPRTIANPGSRIHDLYTARYDADGVIVLEKTGEEDIYDEIQSHKDSVDIHVILDQFQRGDTEALMKRQGNYVDITAMPKTYAEILNAVIAGEQYFMQLPLETRARFGHSFEQWMASMDKPDFAEKMGLVTAPPAVSPDPSKGDKEE